MTASKCSLKLYVGNLSFSTGENELRELFSPHGTVTDLHLVTDRMSGRSRGFAFVTMGNRHEGQTAMNGLEHESVDGRDLTVNGARPKTEHHQDGSFSRLAKLKRLSLLDFTQISIKEIPACFLASLFTESTGS